MGHQESLLFCDSKSDMLRLCKLLNRAASDSSARGLEYAGLDIFEVARLKQTVKTKLPGEEKGPIFTAGCYAVWWGGERAPQTMDEFCCHTLQGNSRIGILFLSSTPSLLLLNYWQGSRKATSIPFRKMIGSAHSIR